MAKEKVKMMTKCMKPRTLVTVTFMLLILYNTQILFANADIQILYDGYEIEGNLIDFGTWYQGDPMPLEDFTVLAKIQNLFGVDNLNVDLPSGFIHGPDPLISSIAFSHSDNFNICLDTSTRGTFSGDVTITGDRLWPLESMEPYVFHVTGTVLPEPASLVFLSLGIFTLYRKRAT